MLLRTLVSRQLFSTLTKRPSLESQLELAWTSKRLLAPAARALALNSNTKSKTKPSLISLERLLATSLWEDEYAYAYVTARELISRFPQETARGGSNMVNSVLALRSMEQFDQINEVVTVKALTAHLEHWKQRVKSMDIEAYTNFQVLTAILEASVRSGNFTNTVQRCHLVLTEVLNVASYLDSDCYKSPLLLEPRALRMLKRVPPCVPLLEEYIGDTLIRSYRFLLQSEDSLRHLSHGDTNARVEVVRAIAILISCMHDETLIRDSVAFYMANLGSIIGPDTGELPAYILFSELCYDLTEPHWAVAPGDEVRHALARQIFDTIIQPSSQPPKSRSGTRSLRFPACSSHRAHLASFYEAAYGLAGHNQDFALYAATADLYRARLLGSSKGEGKGKEWYQCGNAALRVLGSLLDHSLLSENRDGRADRVGAELASIVLHSPQFVPDYSSVVRAVLGKPEKKAETEFPPPNGKDVSSLVRMCLSAGTPTPHTRGHRPTAQSNIGIAIMEWCFASIDAHRTTEGGHSVVPSAESTWAPPMHEEREEEKEISHHQQGHTALCDEDKTMLRDVALSTWNALSLDVDRDVKEASLRAFVDYTLHTASSAQYRNAPLLLSLASALHDDTLRRRDNVSDNKKKGERETLLPFSPSAIDQAVYGCASAGEADVSWHGVSTLFSLCLDAQIAPSSTAIFYLVHALCNLGHEDRAARAVLVITRNVQAASKKCEEKEKEGGKAFFLERNQAVLPPLVSFTEAASRLLKKHHSQRGREAEGKALLLAEDLYCKAREVYGEQVFSPPRPFHYRTNTAATKGYSSSLSYKGPEG